MITVTRIFITLWMLINSISSSIVPRVPFLLRKNLGGRESSSVRVVTDIDDTVKSSGGVRLFGIALGGVDTQYDRGDFYPGAIQFAFELSRHKVSKPTKLSVLTARAREFKFALAVKPDGKLGTAYRTIGEKHGHDDWGIEHVYYGSVKEWIFQDRKGIRKFRNFEKLLQNDSDRNHKYIFVGDTGEKDEDAGERMIQKHAGKIKAIFLHSVSDAPDRSKIKLPTDRLLNGVPIFYFKTYVGAALKAYQHHFLCSEALGRVVSQATTELNQIEPYPAPGSPLSSRWQELEADTRLAEQFIPKKVS